MATGGISFSESVGSEDLSDVVCDPCQEDGELHKAVGMCVDCQDYLCERCFDAHKIARAYRKHELLNKESMLKSQVVITKDTCTENCSVHDGEIVKYYCIKHYQLGCSACITLDHRSCDSVTYIPHAAKDLANNEEYKQAENHLKSVVQRFSNIADDIKRKSDTLEKCCSDAVNEIQEFRKEINQALDKIEADIIKKCETMKSIEQDKMKQIVNKFKIAQKELQSLMATPQMYQNNKTNCNLYTVMMKTKDQLKLAEDKIKEAEKEQKDVNSLIKFAANNETMETMIYSQALGQLVTSRTAATLTPVQTSVRRGDQTNVTNNEGTNTNLVGQYIRDIKVKSTDEKYTCNITGLVVLPDKRLVVTDFRPLYTSSGNGHAKLVDAKHDKVITTLALSSSPFDVAMVTNNQIAVTLPYDKTVAFVSVSAAAMNVDRKLRMDGTCFGVDYKQGKLAVTLSDPGKVQVLTLQGSVLHTITNYDIRPTSEGYVVFGYDNTSLYVSSQVNNKVVHVKFDGTTINIYKQRDLNSPHRLVAGSSGNVYVCGMSTSSIHKFASDCKKGTELLNKADGLDAPQAMSLSDTDCLMYVGMYYKNMIKVYSLKDTK